MTIKYAMLGFGKIAEARIAKEGYGLDAARFKAPTLYELVGATDHKAQRRFAAEALGLKWYASTEAVLADEQIEAVFIATNNLSHYPLAKSALLAGKHVIVEKPMATQLDHARELRSLARERGLSLTPDHMMLFNTYNQLARNLIAGGALGAVNDVCVHMEFLLGATSEEAQAWRCANPAELGGPLGDVGSHCLYMAEYLLSSRITRLACAYLPKTLNLAVEEGAVVQFSTAADVMGTVRVAFNQKRGTEEGTFLNTGYEVYGTQGVLRAYGSMYQVSGHPDEPIDLRLEIDRYKSLESFRPRAIHNIYQEAIRQHAVSIIEHQPLDGSNGVHNLEMVLASHQSAQSGAAWVELSPAD